MTLPTTTIAPVALRPIRPDDKLRLAAGLTCLSEETRYRRFLSAKPRFTDTELRFVHVDHRCDPFCWNQRTAFSSAVRTGD